MVTLDEKFMALALGEAEKAAAKNEVPVGAVGVQNGKVVARAHNIRESTRDPLGHAEILLLKKLAKSRGRWRLSDMTIYATLEPCLMCMGALIQARVACLVFGAMDPKAGACGSLYNLSTDLRVNHRIAVIPRVLEEECGRLLSGFFALLRGQRRRKSLKFLAKGP